MSTKSHAEAVEREPRWGFNIAGQFVIQHWLQRDGFGLGVTFLDVLLPRRGGMGLTPVAASEQTRLPRIGEGASWGGELSCPYAGKNGEGRSHQV